jgi:hypothetical protein
MLTIPHCLHSRLTDGGKVVSPTHRPHFTPRKIIIFMFLVMLGGIPVPTAWRVLGLRMEERPPDMEVSCEYIE